MHRLFLARKGGTKSFLEESFPCSIEEDCLAKSTTEHSVETSRQVKTTSKMTIDITDQDIKGSNEIYEKIEGKIMTEELNDLEIALTHIMTKMC